MKNARDKCLDKEPGVACGQTMLHIDHSEFALSAAGNFVWEALPEEAHALSACGGFLPAPPLWESEILLKTQTKLRYAVTMFPS